MTLGQTPYVDIDPFEMAAYLKDGYRIAQPINCPDELWVSLASPSGHVLQASRMSAQYWQAAVACETKPWCTGIFVLYDDRWVSCYRMLWPVRYRTVRMDEFGFLLLCCLDSIAGAASSERYSRSHQLAGFWPIFQRLRHQALTLPLTASPWTPPSERCSTFRWRGGGKICQSEGIDRP